MSRIEKLENLLAIKEAVREMVEKDGRKVNEERLNGLMKSVGDSYMK